MKKEVQEAINTIKTFLGMEKEVKLAQEVLEDGAVLEADSFEAGQAVSIVNEDERIALPVGEYELPEDRILVVQEEGIIAEIKTKEVEEVEEEAPEMEQVKEEAPMMSEEPAKEIKKTVESIVKETFFSEIEELKKENEELKAKLTELSKVEEVEEVKEEVKEEVVELKEEEPKPIQHNPENKVEREVVKFGKKNDRLSQILNKVYK